MAEQLPTTFGDKTQMDLLAFRKALRDLRPIDLITELDGAVEVLNYSKIAIIGYVAEQRAGSRHAESHRYSAVLAMVEEALRPILPKDKEEVDEGDEAPELAIAND